MQPNKVIENIYPNLLKICAFVSKNHEFKHDLASEVVLSLLQNKRLVEIYLNEDIDNYAFRIAYIKWNMSNGTELGSTAQSCFKSMYRDYEVLNNADVEDLKYKLTTVSEESISDKVKEAIDKLPNDIQRMTITKYLELGCNLKELSNEVGVSRYHLKKFITQTCNQIKIIYDRSN